METNQKQQLADKMVNNFINNFYETFGVKPKVAYKVNFTIPTLNEIFDAVNNEFQNVFPGRYIDEKNRDYRFLKYRAIYYSIARFFGYSFQSMAQLCNQDHATVLNALKQVQETSPLKTKIIEQFKSQTPCN